MIYRALFRLVFARMDPEHAHELVVALLRFAQKVGATRLLRLGTSPARNQSVHTLGLTFESPFGLAAGFDKNALTYRILWGLGFGHVEVGTVTALAQAGNPKPRLFRLLADNALSGKIPSTLTALGSSLKELELQGNALTGRLPPWLGAFSLLQ